MTSRDGVIQLCKTCFKTKVKNRSECPVCEYPYLQLGFSGKIGGHVWECLGCRRRFPVFCECSSSSGTVPLDLDAASVSY